MTQGPLRILQVGKFYSPYRGGMETHLEQLCGALRDAGHRVEALVSSESRRGTRERVGGIDVTRVGTAARIASASFSPGMARHIGAAAAHVVHLHLPNPPALLACLASGYRGPVVVTYHSDIVRQKLLRRVIDPLVQRGLARAAAILVSSPNYLATSATLAAHRDRCHVVPFGIPLAPFDAPDAAAVAAIRGRYGPRIVLAVGRHVGYKGFEHLIRAMRGVDGRLLLIGDGPLRASLEAEVRRSGVAHRVTFLGAVDDAYPYHQAAAVFALPSVARSEAFGIVQLEAMAARTPVVNTRLDSGVPFVSLDRVTGLTVPPGDATALAGAIAALLDDPARAASYGDAARQRVEAEFTLDRMVSRTVAIYRSVVRAAA